jgi:hypothetical protein
MNALDIRNSQTNFFSEEPIDLPYWMEELFRISISLV